MNDVKLEVLGIFHSTTMEIKRSGTRALIVETIIHDGGFWFDENTFIPYQAILRFSF